MLLAIAACAAAATQVTTTSVLVYHGSASPPGGLSKVAFIVNNYLNGNVELEWKEPVLTSGLWEVAPMDTPRKGMIPSSYVGSEVPAFGVLASMDNAGDGINGTFLLQATNVTQGSYCKVAFNLEHPGSREVTLTTTKDVAAEVVSTSIIEDVITFMVSLTTPTSSKR
jgi:hypothetical protein